MKSRASQSSESTSGFCWIGAGEKWQGCRNLRGFRPINRIYLFDSGLRLPYTERQGEFRTRIGGEEQLQAPRAQSPKKQFPIMLVIIRKLWLVAGYFPDMSVAQA